MIGYHGRSHLKYAIECIVGSYADVQSMQASIIGVVLLWEGCLICRQAVKPNLQSDAVTLSSFYFMSDFTPRMNLTHSQESFRSACPWCFFDAGDEIFFCFASFY